MFVYLLFVIVNSILVIYMYEIIGGFRVGSCSIQTSVMNLMK